MSKKHYLVDLIIDNPDDDEITNCIDEKLSHKCFINCDNLFLTVGYLMSSKMTEELVCKILDIPVSCITYRSTRKDSNGRPWNVLYFTWESIAGAII